VKQQKPIIHNRDHEHGGADVVRVTWAKVGTAAAVGTVDAASGLTILTNLPAADPGVAGAVWNDGGTLKVSAGP
jgi:hypothetical protein